MNMMNTTISNYLADIKQILSTARQQAYAAIYYAMVDAFWKICERIVLEYLNCSERA